MSRFAAIEARCTQYPASTNDVVWLTDAVRDLRAVLLCLGRPYPQGALCFCDMAIGNPMYRVHTRACQQARRVLESLDEPNLPLP